MDDILMLGILVLAGGSSWRLTSLLHTEDAFEWLRRWIGIENDAEGYPAVYPETFLGDLFKCFWCLSLMTSALVTALVALSFKMAWPLAILFWLGSSALAIWLERQIMRTQMR